MVRPLRTAAVLLIALAGTTACAANLNEDVSRPSPGSQQVAAANQNSNEVPVDNIVHGYDLATWPSTVTPPRATGIRETLLILHNADLHFARNVGFHVIDLTASAFPRTPGQPLRLDDPTSFYIVAHQGKVLVSETALSALLNEYTFNFEGAPLRNISIEMADGTLQFSGQYDRNGWVDFSMSGDVTRVNDHVLKLVADTVSVEGRPAGELLAAAHVELDDLLDISANGVVLKGNTIWLDALKLFPPPELRLSIEAARITDRGLVLKVDDGVTVPDIDPVVQSDSYILIKGGDVKIMNTIVRGANLELHSKPPGETVGLVLYHYRKQLVHGFFKLLLEPQELFIARVPALEAATGRLHESSQSMLAAQQATLEKRRTVWRTINLPPEIDAPATIQASYNSGVEGVWVRIHNVDLYFQQGIGFHAINLVARLTPKKPGGLVNLNHLDQFTAAVAHGCVRVTPQQLTALFNRHILDYEPRPLNDIKITTSKGALTLNGEIKLWSWFPGFWMPVHLTGPLTLDAQGRMVYTPDRIDVLKIRAQLMLHAVNLPLNWLLSIDAPGVTVGDYHILLDVTKVFPPPAIITVPGSAQALDGGVKICFNARPEIQLAPPADAGDSYVWIQGGDIAALDKLIVNANVLVESMDGSVLQFNIAHYKQRIADGGKLTMDHKGILFISLPESPDSADQTTESATTPASGSQH